MTRQHRWRRVWRQCAYWTMGGALILGACEDSENFNEFRQTAGPTIETGVLSILTGDGDLAGGIDSIVTGIINGLFDVIEPDSSTSSS